MFFDRYEIHIQDFGSCFLWNIYHLPILIFIKKNISIFIHSFGLVERSVMFVHRDRKSVENVSSQHRTNGTTCASQAHLGPPTKRPSPIKVLAIRLREATCRRSTAKKPSHHTWCTLLRKLISQRDARDAFMFMCLELRC